MAEPTFDFDTSSDEDDFEGFTPEDVARAIQRGAELREVHQGELSDISLSDFSSESENEIQSDDEDEILPWSENLSGISVPDFSEPVGPTTVLDGDKSELDFLSLIFTPALFVLLTVQTNLYAEQQSELRPDPNWIPTSVEEMRAFIGIRIYMSILQLPSMDMYWSTDATFGNLFISNIMPRDRFDKLSQYFHTNDSTQNHPRGDPRHDRLHHVRPILDVVRKTCLEEYQPHQNTSVDEAMIAFRGRLGFRQYLPAKPTKYGIKVWMRADSENGYANEFDIYTGKKGDEQNAQYGLTTRVVLNLTRNIAYKNHIINLDNFFTSFQLFDILKRQGTYARGTARSNRKDFPAKILHPKCVKNQGDMKVVQKGKTVAYAWKDKKVIYFLSTADDPTENNGQVQRRQRDGTQRQVQSPGVVQQYNLKMNGVDKSDQTRTEYPTYRMCKRWWTYIFFFLLDLSIANAFILMKESENHKLTTKTGKDKDRSLLSFRMNLTKQLLGTYRASRKRRRVSNMDPHGVGHWPKESVKRGRCRQCAKDKKRSDVKWECTGCGVHLCVVCFEPFHRV